MAILKTNVRAFLLSELGEAYPYYDTEDSILDSTLEEEKSCGIPIFPAGDSDDGSMLLHGEGVVLFDRATLMPTKLDVFVW